MFFVFTSLPFESKPRFISRPFSHLQHLAAVFVVLASGVGTGRFPKDVVERAREYREIIGPSGTGAYTHSQGIFGFRKHIAEYIEARDGYKSFPGNIFLTNGASSAIAMVLQGLLASNKDAVMIPIPQYPIYSALISKLGGRQVGYELDEDLNWAVSREELESKLEKAKLNGLDVKALAMINPGNPSGNVMTHCDIVSLYT